MKIHHRLGAGLAYIFLCLTMLAGFIPARAAAPDGGEKFSDIVKFQSITLHYAGADGQPEGAAIQDNTLLVGNRELVLRYTYQITEEQCKRIAADTPYYLEVSPHLTLPHLESGAVLSIDTGAGKEPFGKIYADGARAWVTFDTREGSSETILSGYDGLDSAYFYLNCNRAGDPPESDPPIDGKGNLYAMKFENGEQLTFGYWEHQPVAAKAQVKKGGSLRDKTITWQIDYTPWQNPSGSDGVTLDTPFELRDTIDGDIHSYVEGSVAIDGTKVPDSAYYSSRDNIPDAAELYVLVEASGAGAGTVLTFGGTRFKAGEATQGNPAQAMAITYQTAIQDELLLPGGSGKKVSNAAQLFAGENGRFNSLDIKGQAIVDVPSPTWLSKTGTTHRHGDGTGSTTDWTVTFYPNGFSFEDAHMLTLHDQLPDGSSLVENSVKIDGNSAAVTVEGDNSFSLPTIRTGSQPVAITYQTHAPEEMYDSGTSLGSNTAWFTFQYGEKRYTTSKATTPVGSGDGSGTPGTDILVKKNNGYHPADRTIEWTVTINPHQAYLKSGTFTDDLSKVGGGCGCGLDGHQSGLELIGGSDNISVQIGGKAPDPADPIELAYSNQCITVKVGEVGARTITLNYTTKVCDPCIFANNTPKTLFKNTISTTDMLIGKNSSQERSASGDSTATVSAAVLNKKPPVYDYKTGTMEWKVEVDGAGLPMTEVVLTDILPEGLAYLPGTLATEPKVLNAAATASGQELTIDLGEVTEMTTVTFRTQVDPEKVGFSSNGTVKVTNRISMNGKADGVEFAEVSHQVEQSFSNHGLVKSSRVDNQQELIQYEVLINPFGLALPEDPALIDTLDQRLQLDTDTLRFYEADLSGTTESAGQKPNYSKAGEGQPLKITEYDPKANRFTVQLPIEAGSRQAYVLAYTADIIRREAGGYSNSVRFEGGSVLLGGNKNNSAAVAGGGGGGGGGVAARKARIAITKRDNENQTPLAGVAFTLYQWDHETQKRGLPFAQGTTDAQGKLSFQVKPGGVYELVETQSLPGYGSAFGWEALPPNAAATDNGLLITAGAAGSGMGLELTNEAQTTDIVFRMLNESGVPMAGTKMSLFLSEPAGSADPVPDAEAVVAPDGMLRFPGVRRGAAYFIRQPGGGIMTIEIPASANEEATITLSDGTKAILTAGYQATGAVTPEQQWTLIVAKVIKGTSIPLAGATVGLYAEEGCKTLIKSEITGQDGTVTFEGLMRGQSYWLKETAAPPDYNLDSTVFRVHEASSLVTISNEPKVPTGDPGDSDNTDIPDGPGDSDDTDIPDGPGDSDNSGIPDGPGDSKEPQAPDNSGASGNTGGPGGTGGSKEPQAPDNSGTSGNFGAPGSAGSSNLPSMFGSVDNREGGNFNSGPDSPKTGEKTGKVSAVAVLPGLSLAIIGLYQCLPFKKRK